MQTQGKCINNEEEVEVEFQILENNLQALEGEQITKEEFDTQYSTVKKLIQNDSLFQRKKRLLKIDSKRCLIIQQQERNNLIQRLISRTEAAQSLMQQLKAHNRNLAETIKQGLELIGQIQTIIEILQNDKDIVNFYFLTQKCIKDQKLMKDSISLMIQFKKDIETVSQEKQSTTQSVFTIKDCSMNTPQVSQELSEVQQDKKSNLEVSISDESEHQQNFYLQNGLQQILRRSISGSSNLSIRSQVKLPKERPATSFFDFGWLVDFFMPCSLCQKDYPASKTIKDKNKK